MAEEVRRAPEELDAGLALPLLGEGDDALEVGHAPGRGLARGCDVPVVEAVEPDAELREELEGGVELVPGGVHRILRGVPGIEVGGRPEGVGALVGEAVPVGDGEAEVVPHRLPADDSVGIVELEREGVVRARAFEPDLLHPGENLLPSDEKAVTHVSLRYLLDLLLATST